MRKLITIIALLPIFLNAQIADSVLIDDLNIITQSSAEIQELSTVRIDNWNTLRHPNFLESGGSAIGSPSPTHDWIWGLNVAHKNNSHPNNASKNYFYGAQVAFGINFSPAGLPAMFIRSTDVNGEGVWAKVLHNKGNQTIEGNLTLTGNDLIIKSQNRGTGGRALVHETNNVLAVNYMGDYTGGVNVQGPSLSVAGGKLYLATKEVIESTAHSYLEYGGHNLVIGSPAGAYRHNIVMIKPGGSSTAPLNSQFIMYEAVDATKHLEKVRIRTNGISHFSGGNVGIGTNTPQYTLDVKGTFRAEKVKVEVNNGADFVFAKNYSLKPLSEVEAFVKENNHLPEIQSEKQMQEEGLDMTDFQIKLLQKIEELTLYAIEQDKRSKEQDKRIEEQEVLIRQLNEQLKNNK